MPLIESGSLAVKPLMHVPARVPDVIALIHAFNEELIFESTLKYLTQQGIGVYLLDNASTDQTVEIATAFVGRGMIAIDQFTDPASPGNYNLRKILELKERIALDLAGRGARWIMHYDADEIRETPWPGVSLFDGLRRAAEQGYNVVDHVLVNFVPTDDSYQRGMWPPDHFHHYLPHNQTNRHGKAWIQGNRPVDLDTRGGHFVKFRGRKVFPIPFIIKHFPILNDAHGRRKVFQERKPRYSKEGLSHDWHRHYRHIQDESHQFIYAPDDPRLRHYDDEAFKRDHLARYPMPGPSFLNRLFHKNRRQAVSPERINAIPSYLRRSSAEGLQTVARPPLDL